jgi:hypothetical protein
MYMPVAKDNVLTTHAIVFYVIGDCCHQQQEGDTYTSGRKKENEQNLTGCRRLVTYATHLSISIGSLLQVRKRLRNRMSEMITRGQFGSANNRSCSYSLCQGVETPKNQAAFRWFYQVSGQMRKDHSLAVWTQWQVRRTTN